MTWYKLFISVLAGFGLGILYWIYLILFIDSWESAVAALATGIFSLVIYLGLCIEGNEKRHSKPKSKRRKE